MIGGNRNTDLTELLWCLGFGVSDWNFAETVEALTDPQFSDSFMKTIKALRSAMAEVDAYYKERGIFQGKFGFGASPALIVIDMAYGWTDAVYAGGSARLDAAVDAILLLLPPARAAGIPVIYTTSPPAQGPQLKSAADFSPRFRIWD